MRNLDDIIMNIVIKKIDTKSHYKASDIDIK